MISSYDHEFYCDYTGCKPQSRLTERLPGANRHLSFSTQPKGEIVFMYKATARCPNSSLCWKQKKFEETEQETAVPILGKQVR